MLDEALALGLPFGDGIFPIHTVATFLRNRGLTVVFAPFDSEDLPGEARLAA